jgi:hypothetical protein
MKHVSESVLSLHASGDLSGWPRVAAAWHVRRCPECREIVEAHRRLRAEARSASEILPEGLNWERLAGEMSANIRLGLAAGEIVAPSAKRNVPRRVSWDWRPAAVVAALAVLVTAAWWLNVPSSDRVALERVLRGLPARGVSGGDRGPVLAATPSGIEFRENGSTLGLGLIGAKPVEVSLSLSGSASAHYVDADTGQVTITTVYVQ